jgi:hypothetical protein
MTRIYDPKIAKNAYGNCACCGTDYIFSVLFAAFMNYSLHFVQLVCKCFIHANISKLGCVLNLSTYCTCQACEVSMATYIGYSVGLVGYKAVYYSNKFSAFCRKIVRWNLVSSAPKMEILCFSETSESFDHRFMIVQHFNFGNLDSDRQNWQNFKWLYFVFQEKSRTVS